MRGTRTFPLKDNLPTDRVPLVTIALIAANLVAWLMTDELGLAQLIVNAIGLWIFGVSVEDSMARWRFLALGALGGLATAGAHAALDGDGGVVAIGATGVVATALGAHLALYPRAGVMTVGFTGAFFGLYELPSWVLAGVWAIAEVVLVVVGAHGVGTGVAAFAWVAGAVVGAAAVRPLAQRRKPQPGRRDEPRPARAPAAVGR
jgi:rhomboid family protein